MVRFWSFSVKTKVKLWKSMEICRKEVKMMKISHFEGLEVGGPGGGSKWSFLGVLGKGP